MFIGRFGGIPSIESGMPFADRENIARTIQFWQMILLFPGIVLISISLTRVDWIRLFFDRVWSFLKSVPRTWFIIVIFVLGLSFSLYFTVYHIHFYPQIIDSHNYYFQSKLFASGRLWVPSETVHQKFFHFIGIMDVGGRRYASSLPGHPIILAVGQLARVPWLVNPVQGGLIVVMIYLLGGLLFTEEIGRFASILSIFSPFRVFQCAIFMSHPTTTLFILIALYALFKSLKSGKYGYTVLFGFCSGFLYLIRPQSAFPILLPFGLYYIYANVRQKRKLYHIFLPIVFVILALAGQAFYNKQLTDDYLVSPRDIVAPSLRPGFGSEVGRPLPDGTFSGHSVKQGLEYTKTNLLLLNREALCWGGFTFLFLIPAILLSGDKRYLIVLMCFSALLTILLYFTYPINSPLFGPRYYFEWFPLYLLSVVVGIFTSLEWIQRMLSRTSFKNGEHLLHPVVLFFFLFLAAWIVIVPSQIDRYFSDIPPNDLLKTVSEEKLNNAVVFVKNNYFNLSYGFAMNDPFLRNKVLYAGDKGTKNQELQWFMPDRQFYSLSDGKVRKCEFSGLKKEPEIP